MINVKPQIDFSIVVPAFNEKVRLPTFLSDLINAMSKSALNGEIIIVDDGSTEENYRTYLQLINSIENVPVKLMRHEKNRGKGAAIQTGFKVAKGSWIGFVDSDGATSPREVLRLIRFALSSNDLDGVIGSRIRMLGYTVKRKTIRHLLGRIFATLTYVFLNVPVYDSQCGCKFFRKSKLLPLLNKCKEQRYLFDIELIAIGYYNKLNFLEVPICWQDVSGSKMHLIRDSLKMAIGSYRIRKRLLIMEETKSRLKRD